MAKILSSILLLLTAYLNFKHAWSGFTMNLRPAEIAVMKDIGITDNAGIALSILSVAVGLMVLFPQTFFYGNLLNAGIILVLMALLLRAGNIKFALIEIPFLLMSLVLIWLGHPFKAAIK